MVAVLVLKGAQDGIVRVGLGGSHKGFQGTGCQPGILVEEVNVVIAVVQGVLKAHIVGPGKAHVLRAAHQMRPGEVLRHIIRTPVRGIVVPHIQVRGKLTRICPWTEGFGRLRGKLTRICPWVHGAETPLQPGRAVIGNNAALDIPLKEDNIKAKGGIMHVLQNTLPYRHNLYEVMLNDPRFVHLGGQLASYEHDEFNPSQSVEGGMVDGEQIYVDSVFNERNLLLERVGELANEDSTYIFVAPVDAEWQRVWQEAMEYYRYDASVEGGDSLQRFWANYALLNDAIFSRTIQSSPKDSLITYRYDKRYPQYHVFHRPFDEGGILYGCTPKDYSNGTLYTANQWPFTPQMTYHRELKTEGEREGLIVERSLCVTNTRVHAADSVSENEYLVITPTGATSNWKLTYRLEDVLAGNYDICAIILPATVYNSRAQLRPCKFKATINYVDETGASKSFNCDNKQFESNPERVDTVVLAENFHFPVCNYDQSSLKISLRLDCSITARETSRYSREMFLDCIYLRPRKNMTTEQ